PFASRKDLDLGAQGLRRKSTIPPDPDRPVRTVAGHDAALNPDAVLTEPYRAGSDGLCSDIHARHLNDCLVAVLFELALAERRHFSNQFGFRHTGTATARCRISASQVLDGVTTPWSSCAGNQRRSPAAFSSPVIFSTACWTSEGFRAPVQTSLPLRNRRIAVFGSLSRKINPGNCSGSYSAPPRTRAIAWRSSSSPRDVDATTFSILMFAKDTPSWAGGGVPTHRLRPDAGSPLY